MDIATLIAALANPQAYPFAAAEIDVRQTHISAVFLAGDFAYKLKKPVKLSFLDFSTLEKRRFYCDEEVRLNRRLASGVYLGVVPVTIDGRRISLEGRGETIEWAVKMRRLPESATLEQRIARNEINADHVRALARRLVSFHATAAGSPHISSFGRFESVARNLRENLEASAPTIGQTISRSVRERLTALTEQCLSDLRPLIDSRAARGVPRDTHGDLHLDHVYLFPEQPQPADLVVVDCIEFNERFRYADPIADMAFLAMDLKYHGRRDLAAAFSESYLEARGEDEGRRLLPLYISYRAAVRGKVDGLQLAEPEIPAAARDAAVTRARGHWLLALQELDIPSRRPCLVLVGGLPGTGKSTLARHVADRADFRLLRSDVIRKELAGRSVGFSPPALLRSDVIREERAGIPAETSSTTAFRAGIYTPEWTGRTYAECLRRAEELLFEGQRVIVDATFLEENHRRQFLNAAARWCVPVLFLVCDTSPANVKARLAARRGDASDADWNVYLQAARHWEEPGPLTLPSTRSICLDESPEECVERACNHLINAEIL